MSSVTPGAEVPTLGVGVPFAPPSRCEGPSRGSQPGRWASSHGIPAGREEGSVDVSPSQAPGYETMQVRQTEALTLWPRPRGQTRVLVGFVLLQGHWDRKAENGPGAAGPRSRSPRPGPALPLRGASQGGRGGA